MAQVLGGVASDIIRALAQEMIDYIQGESARAEDIMQSSGQVLSSNQRKGMLLDEVTNKVKAAIPVPTYGVPADAPSKADVDAKTKAAADAKS